MDFTVNVCSTSKKRSLINDRLPKDFVFTGHGPAWDQVHCGRWIQVRRRVNNSWMEARDARAEIRFRSAAHKESEPQGRRAILPQGRAADGDGEGGWGGSLDTFLLWRPGSVW